MPILLSDAIARAVLQVFSIFLLLLFENGWGKNCNLLAISVSHNRVQLKTCPLLLMSDSEEAPVVIDLSSVIEPVQVDGSPLKVLSSHNYR